MLIRYWSDWNTTLHNPKWRRPGDCRVNSEGVTKAKISVHFPCCKSSQGKVCPFSETTWNKAKHCVQRWEVLDSNLTEIAREVAGDHSSSRSSSGPEYRTRTVWAYTTSDNVMDDSHLGRNNYNIYMYVAITACSPMHACTMTKPSSPQKHLTVIEKGDISYCLKQQAYNELVLTLVKFQNVHLKLM